MPTKRKTKTKATTAKTRKTPAKKASKEMMYTDGKAAVQTEEERLNDLEKILNPAALSNKFGSQTEADFETKMADMTIPELQSLAVSVGVFPSGSRTTLKNKLLKEFKQSVFGGKGKIMQSEKPLFDLETLTDEQRKLFREI